MEILRFQAQPYYGPLRGSPVVLEWDGADVRCPSQASVQVMLDGLADQLRAGAPCYPPGIACPVEAAAYSPTTKQGLAWFLASRFALPADLQALIPVSAADPHPVLY